MTPAIKVLVTGQHGQLARALAERAEVVDGISVICLGRPTLDFLVPDTIATAVKRVGPDFVVNAAAYTAVDLAEDEPEQARAVNAIAAGTLAAAANAAGAPIIHISTDYVFDGSKPGTREAYSAGDP